MSLRLKLLVLSLITAGLALNGCGGGGGSNKPVISVGLSPAAAQAIDQGQQLSLTATVTNDSANAGVTWSETGPGSLSNQKATTATFTAASSGTPGPASVTATSVTDTTKSAAVNITIAAVPAITTTSLPSGTTGPAYSATVKATGGAGALTYSVSTGNLPAGLKLNSSTGAITGTPTATGTSNFTVNSTDASTAGPMSASQPLSITVLGTLSITTTSLLNPMINEAYSQTLQYAQTDATLPVTWTLATGSGPLPAGLNLNAGTGAITGTPTTTGGPTNFTVQLADSSVPPQVATKGLSVTVTGANTCGSALGSEGLLTGQYAISLLGFDASGPAGMLASFTADGAGHITAGVEDINSVSGVQTNVSVTTASSSYTVGSDHRGCLTLVAGAVTRVFQFSVGGITSGVASNGRIIEFDTTGMNATGTIGKQNSTYFSNAQISGANTFRVKSPLSGGGFYAAVGVLDLDGAGSVTGGVGDINNNGTMDPGNGSYPGSPISFNAGSYSISANGRGTLSFTPATSGAATVHLVGYVQDSSQVNVMSTDAQSVNTLFSGVISGQSGGPFTLSSLNAAGVLFGSGRTGSGSGSRVEAGVFTPDGSGNFSFAGDVNNGGTLSSPSTTGTYTVDGSTGRVLVTDAGGASPAWVLYLRIPNNPYLLSADTYAMTGDLEPQQGAGSFTNSSLKAAFTFSPIDPAISASWLTEGVETFDGGGNVTGTFDVNASGFLSLGNAITGTYAVSSNGRVVTPASGTIQKLLYIINTGRAIAFDYNPGDPNPTLIVVQQ